MSKARLSKTRRLEIAIVALSLIGCSLAASYGDQGSWGGTCTALTSKSQSPIDIQDFKGACDNSIKLDLKILNAGTNYTFAINQVSDPGYLQINTVMSADNSTAKLPFQLYASDLSGNIYGYNFTEARVHAPAEHTIEGQSFSMELQLFFTLRPEFGSRNLTTAAMSFLFQESQDKKVSIPVLNFFQQALNGSTSAVGTLSDAISSILPSPLSYFLYQGSDTVPGCSETVLWYVVETPIDISTAQISMFDSIYKNNQAFANGNGNNRNTQALNGRVIKKGGVECEEQFIYFFSFVLLYAFINYFIFKLL